MPEPLNYRGPEIRQKWIEDPESRRWRFKRVLYYLALAIVIVPCTAYFVKNVFEFGRMNPLSVNDFIPQAQHAIPMVRAIKEYQRDHGPFSGDFSALAPQYLKPEPAKSGDVSADWNQGQLIIYSRYNQIIHYDFTPGREGWTVSGAFVNGPLPIPMVSIPASTPSTQGS